jgi:uroporphyrin-III C-methyltransferase
MIFGRADEEMAALRSAGISFTVVPGVTAALAAAASIQTSLTLRGIARSVTIVTPAVGHGESEYNVAEKIPSADTLAVYMGLKQAARWAKRVLHSGRPSNTPVLICESVSTPNEQIRSLTLAQLANINELQSHTDGPSLILIGEALANYQAAAKPAQPNQYTANQG